MLKVVVGKFYFYIYCCSSSNNQSNFCNWPVSIPSGVVLSTRFDGVRHVSKI